MHFRLIPTFWSTGKTLLECPFKNTENLLTCKKSRKRNRLHSLWCLISPIQDMANDWVYVIGGTGWRNECNAFTTKTTTISYSEHVISSCFNRVVLTLRKYIATTSTHEYLFRKLSFCNIRFNNPTSFEIRRNTSRKHDGISLVILWLIFSIMLRF